MTVVLLRAPSFERFELEKPPKGEPRPTLLQRRLRVTTHQVVKRGTRLRCTACPLWGPLARTMWLLSQCAPRRYSVPGLAAGAHPSHRLGLHRGLLYCRKCGCYKSKNLAKLARPCEPPERRGRANLSCIARDVKPNGLRAWPLDGAGG